MWQTIQKCSKKSIFLINTAASAVCIPHYEYTTYMYIFTPVTSIINSSKSTFFYCRNDAQ